jgi:hypothetical protein
VIARLLQLTNSELETLQAIAVIIDDELYQVVSDVSNLAEVYPAYDLYMKIFMINNPQYNSILKSLNCDNQ